MRMRMPNNTIQFWQTHGTIVHGFEWNTTKCLPYEIEQKRARNDAVDVGVFQWNRIAKREKHCFHLRSYTIEFRGNHFAFHKMNSFLNLYQRTVNMRRAIRRR